MKRLATALALAATLALAGCSTPPPVADEHTAFQVITLAHPELGKVEKHLVTDVAQSLCELFDLGGTIELALLAIHNPNVTEEMRVALIWYAVNGWCPEHHHLLSQ